MIGFFIGIILVAIIVSFCVLDELGVINNHKQKVCNKNNLKDSRYYKWGDTIEIFDTLNEIAINTYKNQYIDYRHFYDRYYGLSTFEPITENEFNKLFKSRYCNCKGGEGYNIVTSKSYNIEEEYNKLNKGYKIEAIDGTSLCYGNRRISVSTDKINMCCIVHLEKFVFKKKACIQCGTCLDEYDEMINSIDLAIKERIEEIKKEELEKKMADDICERE